MWVEFAIDIKSIILFLPSVLGLIISLIDKFEDRHKQSVSDICVCIKGKLEKQIQTYSQIGTGRKKTTTEEIDANKEQVLTEIYKLSNDYYRWSHLIIKVKNTLRRSAKVALFTMALSVLLSFKIIFPNTWSSSTVESLTNTASSATTTILLVAFFILVVEVCIPLYNAMFTIPSTIDQANQQIRDGILRKKW